MVLTHIIGMFTNPSAEWKRIREDSCGLAACMLKHVAVLAAVPAVSAYIGTTQVGWQVGTRELQFLSVESAATMALLTYLAMVLAVFGMGWMIRWMSKTYGSEQTLANTTIFAAYVVTPLFLIGIMLLYPLPWLNMLLGLPAVGYSVYLLYGGISPYFDIPEERGFMFASSVLGLGLVAMVAILAATVVLWGFGLNPEIAS